MLRSAVALGVCLIVVVMTAAAFARDEHDAAHAPAAPSAWTLHADGVVFATLDRQTGPRGATQFVSQNWAMVMGMRPLGRGMLTLTAMSTAEPASIGQPGYPELFQE